MKFLCLISGFLETVEYEFLEPAWEYERAKSSLLRLKNEFYERAKSLILNLNNDLTREAKITKRTTHNRSYRSNKK